jgi:transposase
LRKGEVLLFWDESGPFRAIGYGGYCWPPIGNPRRQWARPMPEEKLYVVAKLEFREGRLNWRIHSVLDHKTIIHDLKIEVQRWKQKRRIILVWDNAPWHHWSHDVTNWITEHNKIAKHKGLPKIKLLPLPKQAPELQPLETDFGVINRSAIRGCDHQTIAQMKKLITYQLRKINRKCPRKIPTLFF